MSIVRWDPFREWEEMGERWNRHRQTLARASERDRESLTGTDWAPPVDIAETPQEYVMTVELPEVAKDDVKVSVQQGVLSIEGERKRGEERPDMRYHRVERPYGCFCRTFSLPDNVDEEKLAAGFKDGVLSIHLPKSEKAQPRTIEVQAA
jgi:HSP20 family protein